MKRLIAVALVSVFTSCLHAQVVDTTVCDVLKNPESFNGKIVRIKGKVAAGFDQFVIKGDSCGQSLNSIWLDYPEGTKGNAGPTAILQLQPAHNFAGTVAPLTRTPVALEKNKDFKQFDSLLAAPYKGSGICLGCTRNQVNATLVGRLDGAKAELRRDDAGKIVDISGFGNMNAYGARLVLQSVTDVSSQEIDYSKTSAITKGEPPIEAGGDQVAAAHQAALAFGLGTPAGDSIERSASAFGKQGEDNGVVIGFGIGNEASVNEGARSEKDSPDGVEYRTTFDMARLKSNALAIALVFTGTQIADIRDPKHADTGMDIWGRETHAWQTATMCAIARGQKTLTLPGGYLVWNGAWTPEERAQSADDAFKGFIANEELMVR